jgi:cytoplasmic polyadenylation element-binding protein
LIFDTEKSVKQLLGSCNYDFNQGHHNWYFKVASKRMRVKEVQVIPWQLADASYVRNGCMTTFGTKTVFVGSLHGMLTAEGLAKVLDDLFQGVVAATVDTGEFQNWCRAKSGFSFFISPVFISKNFSKKNSIIFGQSKRNSPSF